MFIRDKRGAVAVIVALCLPLVIAGAGFGVEVAYWRYDQVRLQQAADAAAYAGAVVAREGGTNILDTATTAATADGYNSTSDTIAVNTPSTVTPSDAHSVEAVISRTETPIFSGLFINHAAVVTVSSTASYSTAGDACILALSKSASKATDFAGNSGLTLNACDVMSDSLASDSVNIQGSATLTVPCIYSSGGDSNNGGVTLTTCPSIKTQQPPVADPYAALPMPTVTPNSCVHQSGFPAEMSAGDYCSMDLKNGVTLDPGVYVIDGGTFKVNANAVVAGSGVTIYLINGANLSINGNSQVNLSAPTTGTYKGMVIMSDRSNSAAITINGNNSSSMTGAIYAPDAAVNYIGNFAGTNGCTQIVAQTIAWSGNTSFGDNCSNAGLDPIKAGSVVRLTA
jgi:uncharacterized membrane protein